MICSLVYKEFCREIEFMKIYFFRQNKNPLFLQAEVTAVH